MSATAIAPALQGFGIGAGLIIAIGAQNAFVLRQGLRRRHVLLVVALCTLCDATLIVIGAAGFGSLVASIAWLKALALWGGVAFLAVYGALCLRAALRPGRLEVSAAAPSAGWWPVAAAAVGFSLLNPHAWLDTVVMLGGIAGQYAPGPRAGFAGGAVAASLVWFVALGYGAARLAPLFAHPAAWRVLDAGVALTLWAIAASLVAARLGLA